MDKESGLESILISYTDRNTGKIEEIPSLHEKWLLDIDIFPYWKFPPALLKDDQDLWFRSLHALRDDVITLLRLPLHIFWSHVIFDPKFHILLDSFLKITPDLVQDSPELLSNELFQSFLEVMFKIFLRMGTNREAQYTKNRTYPDFTATAFADLLYDNYLFDLPKILDLCQIFSSNRNLLGEMLEGIFRKQKKYFYDIQEMIRTTLAMLAKISEEMGCKLQMGDEDTKLTRLEDKSTKQLTFDRFYEIILFVENIFKNLEGFFVTCPSASQCFTPLFMNHFVSFYELFVPAIVQMWLLYKDKLCERGDEFIQNSLRKTKFNFCKIFSYIFENCYFKKFQVTPLVLENIQAPLEDFLTICNILIGTKYLLCEYSKFFDLKTEFIRMKDSGIIDGIQFGYLTEPLSLDEPKSKPELEPELEEAIVSIQAILPDVDTASIREVLKVHNLNVPHAINTLFERIPTVELTPTSRTIEVLVPKPLELVSQRRNIFTGDEFDIFTRDDVDTSLIHRGKKERFSDEQSFLNNRDLSDVTLKLANIELEYDDEYDDTYDDIPCDVGVDKQDGEGIERLNPKGMYSNRHAHPDVIQGSDDDEVETIQPAPVPQFINRKPDNRGYQHHIHQNAYTREATRADKQEQRGYHTRKKGSAGREQHHWDNAGYYGGRRGTGGQDKGAKTKY